MRIVRGHPRIGHIAEHAVVITNLEFLREPVEAEFRRFLPDSIVPLNQFTDFVICHMEGCYPPLVIFTWGYRRPASYSLTRSLDKKALKEGQMSSLRSISTAWKFGSSSRRNTLSIED